MKKVLIISYYWPPSGGAGVQRWLKFSKYLSEFGWEPIVYTPTNPEIPEHDDSLLEEAKGILTLKRPIWEPYSLYKRFTGSDPKSKIQTGFLTEDKKAGITQKFSVWLRGNLFIPDARKYWIAPSVKFLDSWLKENPVDAIISTGPPHSMHVIARDLKRKTGITWFADFRDPWTNIDYYTDLMLSRAADDTHRKMEKEVLSEADKIIVVGKTMKEEFDLLMEHDHSWNNKKCIIITNGYDESDLNTSHKLDEKFSLAHIGSLVPSRNPDALWRALHMLCESVRGFKDDLKIRFAGKVDISVRESLKKYDLENYVEDLGYLPHSKVSEVQSSSRVLLLLLNNTANAKGILTGKFFEYLASGRPILCVGPLDSDVAKIIEETKSGSCADFDDFGEIRDIILACYDDYNRGQETELIERNIDKYSRLSLTAKLASELDDFINLNE